MEEHLYRLTLEAITNAVKHAKPGSIEVRLVLTPGSKLESTVRDDGAGFDTRAAHPGHLGLTTMRDRAAAAGAQLEITSTPGGGATVTATVAVSAPSGS